VLSVDTPLSIQVHPSKDQARQLHAKDPKNFPDSNHKPEVVVALSEFEVLSGFKEISAIIHTIGLFPELRLLLGQEKSKEFQQLLDGDRSGLHKILERFYATDAATLQRIVAMTHDRLERFPTDEKAHKLFLYLVSRGFEADPGVFVALFLEHQVLKPGEAMFTPDRVLHAYLKGDAIECMANSDNVVRAGLTPKHQDIAVLLEVVDWSGAAKSCFYPVSSKSGPTTVVTPAAEFSLQIYHDIDGSLGRLGPLGAPELLVLLEGSARTSHNERMEIGDGFFIPADSSGDSINCTDAMIVRVSIPH